MKVPPFTLRTNQKEILVNKEKGFKKGYDKGIVHLPCFPFPHKDALECYFSFILQNMNSNLYIDIYFFLLFQLFFFLYAFLDCTENVLQDALKKENPFVFISLLHVIMLKRCTALQKKYAGFFKNVGEN